MPSPSTFETWKTCCTKRPANSPSATSDNAWRPTKTKARTCSYETLVIERPRRSSHSAGAVCADPEYFRGRSATIASNRCSSKIRARDRAGAQRELSFGAGLFEELEFVLDHDPGGFFVTGIKAKDQLGAIRSDLEMASGSGCDGIVYPELTITGDTLGEIRKKVGAGEWRSDLSFVIAGSRHEMVDKQRFNICSILNGYGGEIGEHRKLFQYTDGTNDAESIELGTELPLLILPDATIAFGICLDYCNISEDPPYADLDVDYVLVPSCGNEKTMEGHVKRSAQYMDVHKTRTLVVQQFFDEKIPKDPPLGYVLCRRDDAALGALDTETRHRWGIYNL